MGGSGSSYRVFPDWGADPVWDAEGAVDLDDLAISRELRGQLRGWSREWEQFAQREMDTGQAPDSTVVARWRRRGQHLASSLQRELGPGVRVDYQRGG